MGTRASAAAARLRIRAKACGWACVHLEGENPFLFTLSVAEAGQLIAELRQAIRDVRKYQRNPALLARKHGVKIVRR